ncbi:P-type ATPase, partial [Trinorchestia longiramus]
MQHKLYKNGDDPVSVCKIERDKVSGHFPAQFRIEAGVPETGPEASDCHDGSSSDDSRDDQCHLLDNRRSNESGFFYRHFTHQHVKFVWCPQECQFVELSALDRNTSVTHVANGFHGDTADLRQARWQLYGPNEIKVEVRSYISLLFTEVLNPFYIFQILSIILWSLDDYFLYASCIFLISCISVAVSLRETRQQSERLHAMVKTNQDATVEVLQLDGAGKLEHVTVGVSELVPGDVMLLPADGCLVPCDCVLLTGTAIVNESMLTGQLYQQSMFGPAGESVPVAKAPLTVGSEEGELYDPEKHKRSTLFCGTLVVQTRYYNNTPVRAVVVRTGFSTAKGELVRSILFPKPILFKFYQDSMKFIFVLFLLALVGMGYTFYLYIVRGLGWGPMLLRSLDLVTIVVPPALPAAMTVGTYYAQQRLHRSSVFCISPPRINVAGKLKLVVFDKTGTLTEDSLEVYGVVGVDNVKSNSDGASSGSTAASSGEPGTCLKLWPGARPVLTLPHDSKLMMALATCHDLTYVFGKLIGDPMDIKMFKATNW